MLGVLCSCGLPGRETCPRRLVYLVFSGAMHAPIHYTNLHAQHMCSCAAQVPLRRSRARACHKSKAARGAQPRSHSHSARPGPASHWRLRAMLSCSSVARSESMSPRYLRRHTATGVGGASGLGLGMTLPDPGESDCFARTRRSAATPDPSPALTCAPTPAPAPPFGASPTRAPAPSAAGPASRRRCGAGPARGRGGPTHTRPHRGGARPHGPAPELCRRPGV
jgi:hypothetical protein